MIRTTDRKSVKTNIGRVFIKLINKHFAPNHKFITDWMLLSCHLCASEWFHSEARKWMSRNVKEVLTRNRRDISSLSCYNGTRIHNHLLRKRTLKHLGKLANLAKWLSVRLRTKWFWVRIPLQSFRS